MRIQNWVDGHAHMGVTDEQSYRTIHANHVKRQHEKEVLEVTAPIAAFINHSRWVVSCSCSGGCLSHPEYPIAACFDCGRLYTNVQFLPPDLRQEVVKIMLERPEEKMRNWTGETPQQLREQNVAEGL